MGWHSVATVYILQKHTGENGLGGAEAGGLCAAEQDVNFTSDVVHNRRRVPYRAAAPADFPCLDGGPLAGLSVGDACFGFVAARERVGVEQRSQRLPTLAIIHAPPHHEVVRAEISACPDTPLGERQKVPADGDKARAHECRVRAQAACATAGFGARRHDVGGVDACRVISCCTNWWQEEEQDPAGGEAEEAGARHDCMIGRPLLHACLSGSADHDLIPRSA
jgi:hypothetical protein